jgi:hydroxyacylglutathione hydrolase
MNPPTLMPLEDELGDVLEKAMRRAGLGEVELGARARVEPGKILDAIDYRPSLGPEELRRLAAALGLNEVGLCALGAGRYPVPAIEGLPFCVWPLHMPHGIGFVNAYLVGECGSSEAILFDTGPGIAALEAAWPPSVKKVAAVFLTHGETEHAGGLCEIVARFGVSAAFVPEGAATPCGQPVGEGETKTFGPLETCVFSTPGHARAHNCYFVRAPAPHGPGAARLRRPGLRGLGGRRVFFPRAAGKTDSAGPARRSLLDGDRPGPRPDDDGRERAPVQSVRLLTGPTGALRGCPRRRLQPSRYPGLAALDRHGPRGPRTISAGWFEDLPAVSLQVASRQSMRVTPSVQKMKRSPVRKRQVAQGQPPARAPGLCSGSGRPAATRCNRRLRPAPAAAWPRSPRNGPPLGRQDGPPASSRRHCESPTCASLRRPPRTHPTVSVEPIPSPGLMPHPKGSRPTSLALGNDGSNVDFAFLGGQGADRPGDDPVGCLLGCLSSSWQASHPVGYTEQHRRTSSKITRSSFSLRTFPISE